MTNVQQKGIETLETLQRSYEKLLGRIPSQLRANINEVEHEV